MPIMVCVWNDRPDGADLGRLPEQWLWESHQSGPLPGLWAGVCTLKHYSSLGKGTWAAAFITKRFGGFDLFWTYLRTLLRLTKPSANWFKFFTVESHHTHIYLSIILWCVLNKKGKRNQIMSGMALLVYPMSMRTEAGTAVPETSNVCWPKTLKRLGEWLQGFVPKSQTIVPGVRFKSGDGRGIHESNQWRIRESSKIIFNIDDTKPCISTELYLVLYVKLFQR